MKTYIAKHKDIERQWHLIDAADQTLGRLSTKIARLLMGKHKPMFAPNADVGDYVVIINAAKFRVTGKKMEDKEYYRHSGYPGGFKITTMEKMMFKHPERVIEHAVKGMMPSTKLGAQMFKKLKVYVGEEHPHAAQINKTQAETKKNKKQVI
ncbi:50S ribosomal protein L13 [Chloroflexota bacterium]